MRFYRHIARVLVLATASMSVAIPTAQAGLVDTGQVVQAQHAQDLRTQLNVALQREDILAQLKNLGVDPSLAQARVNSLTDEEAQALSDKMGQLPAGGDGIVGALIFIFVLLLVTDILGLTHVFPFVKHR